MGRVHALSYLTSLSTLPLDATSASSALTNHPLFPSPVLESLAVSLLCQTGYSLFLSCTFKITLHVPSSVSQATSQFPRSTLELSGLHHPFSTLKNLLPLLLQPCFIIKIIPLQLYQSLSTSSFILMLIIHTGILKFTL